MLHTTTLMDLTQVPLLKIVIIANDSYVCVCMNVKYNGLYTDSVV